ncbi:oxygen-independent coproporphyrinogen III oxidase [Cytophagaceae bacterium ABcell3]|nr:oxygen-independent coproporphyrinogen III oxidase [Cytophagaceae bacterium ABcell3]
MNRADLISKYDIPAPRYTSYPTVPYWESDGFDQHIWAKHVGQAFQKSPEISLYLHLPFCEQLCTYCGCNKRITKNHKVETPYLNTLLKEWNIYLEIFGGKPIIKELHLGGGTPTFFTPQNLKYLLESIFSKAIIPEDPDFSIEVHPNYTTKEHLHVLAALGFKRLSAGIQDFDPKVQIAINRVQTFEQTKIVFDEARKAGFTSLNADIIYGLPFQKLESVKGTISKTSVLKPERIAFYSYAHVPWKSKAQRRYSEEDLPSADEKRELYEKGKEMLVAHGYTETGMDHFSLPQDDLYIAMKEGKMHRNFMGYTVQNTGLLIGLGASSISDSTDCFMQNVKEVEEYEKVVNEGRLPVLKGHELTEEDLFIRQHILDLMCRMETSWDASSESESFKEGLEKLEPFIEDNLVVLKEGSLKIKKEGKPFIRNICMCFDARLWRKIPETPIFSKSI